MRTTGVELRPNDCKGNHDGKMDQLGYSFEERVDTEANVEHDHLKPGEPKDGKEADIGGNS